MNERDIQGVLYELSEFIQKAQELIDRLATTQQGGRSSVEVSRTAKGETTWSVKVYVGTSGAELATAKEQAQGIHRELTEWAFPPVAA